MARKGADESDPTVRAALDALSDSQRIIGHIDEEYKRMRAEAEAARLLAIEACKGLGVSWPSVARIVGGRPNNVAAKYSAALAELNIARADRGRAGAAGGRGSGRRGTRPAGRSS